jgi:hypothetical protein
MRHTQTTQRRWQGRCWLRAARPRAGGGGRARRPRPQLSRSRLHRELKSCTCYACKHVSVLEQPRPSLNTVNRWRSRTLTAALDHTKRVNTQYSLISELPSPQLTDQSKADQCGAAQRVPLRGGPAGAMASGQEETVDNELNLESLKALKRVFEVGATRTGAPHTAAGGSRARRRARRSPLPATPRPRAWPTGRRFFPPTGG